MCSVSAIIGVAVGSGTVLLIAAVVLAVKIERRRHAGSMHLQEAASPSHQQVNLSASENDYAHTSRPLPLVRRNGRAASITAIWNTVPSGEWIQPQPEPGQTVNDDSMPSKAQRREAVPSSLNLQSLKALSSRQQARKCITVQENPPLPAITRSTDFIYPSNFVELPTINTPRQTPENSPNQPPSCVQIQKRQSGPRELPLTDKTSLTRRVCGISALLAPIQPLTPLPTFHTYLPEHFDSSSRTSKLSLARTNNFALGKMPTFPMRRGIGATIPSAEIQSFDFGFDAPPSSARIGIPPGRPTMQGLCSGITGISSITPSFDYGKAFSLEAAQASATADVFMSTGTIDWNVQSTNRSRHSPQNYGSSSDKRNFSSDMSSQLLRRPASVASSNLYQWAQKPAFALNRFSLRSNESRKEHEPRHSVRISNISITYKPNSKVEQMPEVEKEQLESTADEVKIPGMAPLEASKLVLQSRASRVEVQHSPSPLQDPCPSSPLSRHGNIFMGLHQESDVLVTAPQTPPSARNTMPNWPLSPQYASPAPPGSPSSVESKHQSSKASLDDIRKVIMTMRDIDLETDLLDTVGRSSMTADEEDINISRSNTASSFTLQIPDRPTTRAKQSYPAARRYGSSDFHLHPHTSGCITLSASHLSIGGCSIWEDMSVRGDSPEPELPELPPSPRADITPRQNCSPRGSQPLAPKIGMREYDPEASENHLFTSSVNGWIQRGPDTKPRNGILQMPQGKGLGLRVGERMLGLPGSLYDGDGFLEE